MFETPEVKACLEEGEIRVRTRVVRIVEHEKVTKQG
jgi:hypothetical protein